MFGLFAFYLQRLVYQTPCIPSFFIQQILYLIFRNHLPNLNANIRHTLTHKLTKFFYKKKRFTSKHCDRGKLSVICDFVFKLYGLFICDPGRSVIYWFMVVSSPYRKSNGNFVCV